MKKFSYQIIVDGKVIRHGSNLDIILKSAARYSTIWKDVEIITHPHLVPIARWESGERIKSTLELDVNL